MDISHATPELFSALASAQAGIENATKNAKNPHFKSEYADLAEVLSTVRPALSGHHLSIMQSTAFDGAMVTVTTMIGHSSGGYITSAASCVPAKTDAQGIGSATTYLRRYALAAMCGIAQEDDDGESAKHKQLPLVAAEQPKSAALQLADEYIKKIRAANTASAKAQIFDEAMAYADTLPDGEDLEMQAALTEYRNKAAGKAAA